MNSFGESAGGALHVIANDAVAVWPAVTVTVSVVGPPTWQLVGTFERATVWAPGSSDANVTLPLAGIDALFVPSSVTVKPVGGILSPLVLVVTARLPVVAGGLSASTLASQVPAPVKYQLHVGCAVPAVGARVKLASYSPSFFIRASPPTPIDVQPAGPCKPAGGLASVTPNASAPALTAMAHG